ncbi:Gr64e family protein [Megaselia abdita]
MMTVFYKINVCESPIAPVDRFVQAYFQQVFSFVEYNRFLGFFGKYLNILSTFAWNFIDIFIMTVGIALSEKFRQINLHLEKAKYKLTPESFWISSRTNYRNLCQLCEDIDDAISPLTVLSFVNNLYFICGKFLKSIHKKESLIHAAYFWFSLFYLVGRTFQLSVSMAKINDESKGPLRILRTVPRASWCKETKRYTEEVTTGFVALSGMKFFVVTRGLIIGVAGTIITYELVLLQNTSEDMNVYGCS